MKHAVIFTLLSIPIIRLFYCWSIGIIDKLFINEWLKKLEEGIVIAFLFYVITQIHDREKKKAADKKTIRHMIGILEEIKQAINNNSVNATIVNSQLNTYLRLAYDINDTSKRVKIESLTEDNGFMEMLRNIDPNGEKQLVINQINIKVTNLNYLLS
jgi:tetrahydromethanopterin S-methyltransferase subunit H